MDSPALLYVALAKLKNVTIQTIHKRYALKKRRTTRTETNFMNKGYGVSVDSGIS
ncbi:hypothetical protein DPMN_166973 [Dreissena polymorpha]|uniref:Uncharacterized protein n=1 Tax=Dreissena polymorpha TaxID=45954 RepID=A0A9D4IUL7_DREPO|nr:hypothetical protein DPMN_166973 [Dreissena polymorpha]